MANNEVHTGFWIDHSKGPVLGATITLNSKWGASLVAAAAIVVQLVGVSLWKIIAFQLHQHFSTPHLRDESDSQRQVILRNTTVPADAAWNILALGLTWRGRKHNAMCKAMLLASVPGIIWIGFIAAGVLVGQVASNSYDNPIVLKKSGSCGFLATLRASSRAASGDVAARQNQNNASTIAQQYSRLCYSVMSSSPISCSVFPTQKLQYNVSRDQPCPIPDNACFKRPGATAITLTSWPMDSHEHLGINTPASDRLTFEHQWTCAPLRYEFVNEYTVLRKVENHNFTIESYTFAFSVEGNPFFEYEPIIDQIAAPGPVGILSYSINSREMFVPWNHPANLEIPNGPFRLVQGDLSILLLMPNGIRYSEPNHDPMFATRKKPANITKLFPWPSRRSVYAMACSSLYQICNPTNSKCTGWQGRYKFLGLNQSDSANLLEGLTVTLDLNERQNATLVRLTSVTSAISPTSVLQGLGDPLLASSYLASIGRSARLPDDQWVSEVTGWFATSLAKIQYLTTAFVSVDLDTANASGVEYGFDAAENYSPTLVAQCHQQRVTAPVNYTNYSFLALIFIACFGLLVPITEGVMQYLHDHAIFTDPESYKHLSYQADGYLELHRLLLESAGYGGWTHSSRERPRTNQAKERIPQIQKVWEGGEETHTKLQLPQANDSGDEESDKSST